MMQFLKDKVIKDKVVLLRTDYDVPLQNKKIIDDSRILASLPSLNYLIANQVKRIDILTHLDRPGGKVVENLRIKPIADYLKDKLPVGSPVAVHENLRFFKGEEANDPVFAKELAQNGQLYVNDAFAVSHRRHASIVLLPKLLPACIGIHFAREVEALDKVLHNPKRPLVFIIGGAKLETKLPLLEKLIKKADELLIGGKLAQEITKIVELKNLSKIKIAKLQKNGKDISLSSAQEFSQKIHQAGTVVWNGPLGIYEETAHSQGTKIIAQAINEAPGYTVIGGGDTEAAATKFKAEDKLDHISMGGGAMLQYLTEGTLPGLEAIEGGRND